MSRSSSSACSSANGARASSGGRDVAHAPASSVEVSPSGSPSSRALSSRRMILPLRVRGSVGRNAISFGATAAPRRLRAWPSSSRRSSSVGLEPRLERDERLDHLADHRVGLADDAGLGHRRVLHQRALDLERADQVAGRLDHVVGAADEPEVAVGVAPREVAGQVPAAGEALAVALLLVQVAAEHRRPAGAQRQLALDVGLAHLLDRAVVALRARWPPRRPAAAGPSSRA